MPVRQEFEKELSRLRKDIIKMGAFLEESILDTVEAIRLNDKELARIVIKNDDLIDDMEYRLQHDCITTVARQQPIATDLRDIMSILNIATDLERMGDHCEDICEYMLKLSGELKIKDIDSINIMACEVKKMVSDTIDAYIRKDVELAKEIIKRDEIIDKYFEDVLEELRVQMENDETLIRDSVNFIFITKYFERISDHATNICEWVLYYVTGKLQK